MKSRTSGIRLDPNRKRTIYLCEMCGRGIQANSSDPVAITKELGWLPHHVKDCLAIATQEKHDAEKLVAEEKHKVRSQRAKERWEKQRHKVWVW